MGLWKEFVAACSNKPKKASNKSQIQQQPSLEGTNSSTVSSQSSSHASKSQLTDTQAQPPVGVNVEFRPTNGLHHAKLPSRNSSLGRSASQQVLSTLFDLPAPQMTNLLCISIKQAHHILHACMQIRAFGPGDCAVPSLQRNEERACCIVHLPQRSQSCNNKLANICMVLPPPKKISCRRC